MNFSEPFIRRPVMTTVLPASGASAARRLFLLHRIYGPATRRLLLQAGLTPGMHVADFGCGVGRVTIPLAAIAKSVIAYDISDRHLRFARERAAALGRTNIRAIAIGDSLPAQFEPCDVFYSRIVLQKLIRSLARGGVGVFQVPAYYVGYRFSTGEALRSPQKFDMDMHCYPQAELFSLIAEEGALLIQVREDDAPGRRDLFISNTFVITKAK